MKTEIITLKEKGNVTLTAYLQSVGGEFSNIPARPAVLILPGGGYQSCSDREANPVAMSYLKAGYHAFILHYSVGKEAAWPNPLNDYEQAMKLIRENADEWNVYSDKIAVIGFSAGGHLAACAATMSENRPNAAILGYAVLNEESAHIWEKTAPDAVSAVDNKTCPCFLFASRTDSTVSIKNTIQFIDALEEHGSAFECHIYAYGPHGFATGDSSVLTPGMDICSRLPHWVEDSIAWLKDMFGDFGDGAMTEPTCPKRINGNSEEFLSVDCTIDHLLQNPGGAQIVKAVMDKAGEHQKSQAVAGNLSQESMQTMMMNLTLRDMLRYGKVPAGVVEQLNAQLQKIPNMM